MNTGAQMLRGEPTNRLLHFVYQTRMLALPHYIDMEDQIQVVKSHFNIPNEGSVSFVVKVGQLDSGIPAESWRIVGDPINNHSQIFVRVNNPPSNCTNLPHSSRASNLSNATAGNITHNVFPRSPPVDSSRLHSPNPRVANVERATYRQPNVANRQTNAIASTSASNTIALNATANPLTDGSALQVNAMDVDDDLGNTEPSQASNINAQPLERNPEFEENEMIPVIPPHLGSNNGDIPSVSQDATDLGDLNIGSRQPTRHSKSAKFRSKRDSDDYEDTDEDGGDISDATSVAHFWDRGGRVAEYRSGTRNPVKCTACLLSRGSICRAQRGANASRCFECRRRKHGCSLSRPLASGQDQSSHQEPQEDNVDNFDCIDAMESTETVKRGRGRPRKVPFGPQLPKNKPGRPRKEKSTAALANRVRRDEK